MNKDTQIRHRMIKWCDNKSKEKNGLRRLTINLDFKLWNPFQERRHLL